MSGEPGGGSAGSEDPGALPDRIRRRLATGGGPGRGPEPDRRAAVVLVLRPDPLSGLFVQRAEVDSDPWSGQMALPGGHREPSDPDLRSTALRELAEETGLELTGEDLLGRLRPVHPRSQRLPSVAVTPFVAWRPGEEEVRHGPEVTDHVWVPLSAFRDPELRSVLTLRREQTFRAFPTLEYGGYTIWGLTHLILRRFLERAGELAGPDPASGPRPPPGPRASESSREA